MTAARLDRVDQQAPLLGSLSEQPFVDWMLSDRGAEVDSDRRPTPPLVDDPLFEQDQQRVIDDLMRIHIDTPFHMEQFDGDYFGYRLDDVDND